MTAHAGETVGSTTEHATCVRRYKPYTVYKYSGVQWLGEIPAHWEVKRLKHVATWNDEVLPEWTDPALEITYVDISSVDLVLGIVETERLTFETAPSRARRIVRDGDVIISTVRTYLRAIASIDLPEPNMIVSTGFAVIRPRAIGSNFTAYGVQASYFVDSVVANSVGVSYPAINSDDLVRLPVICPTDEEQRAIVAFLGHETAKIDALLAKKERLIDLLHEKRTALITRAVTKGLDPDAPMYDSGVEWLAQLPTHWSVRRLKRISRQISVGVVVNPSSYISDEGVPFVYGSDIREGGVVAEIPRKMSSEQSALLSKSRLNAGDLVMVRVGAPGVTAVISPDLEGANCASVVIVRRENSFDSNWLCYVMNSRIVRYQVALVQYGAAQEQFNVAHAVEFVVPTPPLGEQKEISAFLDRETTRIDDLIANIRKSIDRFNELRTALISAAVTGKIDVRETMA